jgi:GrpB-like predicted nucleotidyltransferase (UPF0157 family)
MFLNNRTESVNIWIKKFLGIRPSMNNNGLEIVAYKSAWPLEFRILANVLREGLLDLALRIDHIGSTSVPGLSAKDVIDIQISVAGFDQQLLSALQAMGYSKADDIERDHTPASFKGSEDEWKKWFFRPPLGQRRTNVHVRVCGRVNQIYPLLFRDFLRAHPDYAATYAEVKQRLARSLADPTQYPDVKDPIVDLIYYAAVEWAERCHWEPGPSDA